MIVVDVIDNGKGLPRENRQRLLEPYMTTREKGTGLGLAIVKKIVEDHGGTLRTSRRAGRISTAAWAQWCGWYFPLGRSRTARRAAADPRDSEN